MSNIDEITHIESVRLSDDGKSVVIIDQTQLPNRTEYLTLSTAQDIWEAIYHLKVRGAPAIGICAGYGIYCLALQIRARTTTVSCVDSGSIRSIWIPPGRRL